MHLCYRFNKKNLILAGLWFDGRKPTMTIFLNFLVQELGMLATEGSVYVCVRVWVCMCVCMYMCMCVPGVSTLVFIMYTINMQIN